MGQKLHWQNKTVSQFNDHSNNVNNKNKRQQGQDDSPTNYVITTVAKNRISTTTTTTTPDITNKFDITYSENRVNILLELANNISWLVESIP